MGLLDTIMGFFGGGGGGGGPLDFGNVDANDIESHFLVEEELDQAERAGEAELAAALAKWGLKSMDHWTLVDSELFKRYGKDPEFFMAGARVQFRLQMAKMASSYEMPAEYIAPVRGIDLSRYAAIQKRLELGQPAAQVLPEYQLDDAGWQEVDQVWSSRMGPQADAFAANILSGSLHAMRVAASNAYGKG